MASVRGSVILLNSSLSYANSVLPSLVVGSSTPGIAWYGGRSAICVGGPVYPPAAANLQVQTLMPDGVSWVMAGSGLIQAGITAAQYVPCDLPPGQYRVFSNSSIASITGLYVSLVGIDYGQ